MKSNKLWIDTETTGLSPSKNGVIQLAMLFEVNGGADGDFPPEKEKKKKKKEKKKEKKKKKDKKKKEK